MSAGYNDTRVLRRDASCPVGERLALIGRNGVGKTTMMATIMGLTKCTAAPSSERRRHNAQPTYRRSMRAWTWCRKRAIFFHLSASRRTCAGTTWRRTVEEAYALFPRLKERRRNGGTQLSGGEQQMLAIARTLMSRRQCSCWTSPWRV